MHKCEICSAELSPSAAGVCASCSAPPRVRSLDHLINDVILPKAASSLDHRKAILAFAMSATEKRALDKLGMTYTSVSLFGRYGDVHETGVDARDLSKCGEGQFAAVYSCCLFDYFLEHEKALAEAFRVTTPGGWFITHICGFRLRADQTAPETIRTIEPAEGFYEYVPKNQHMLSVRVGVDWYLDAMRKAGYIDCECIHYVDASSNVKCDWFVGRKPGAATRKERDGPQPERGPRQQSGRGRLDG